MSLFPAYAQAGSDDLVILENEGKDWLSNPSFKKVAEKPVVDISSDSSDDEPVEISLSDFEKNPSPPIVIDSRSDSTDSEKHKVSSRRHKKEKKKKQKHQKSKIKYEKEVKNVYFEDKRRDRVNFTIDTFHSRARPSYNLGEKFLGFISAKKGRKENFQRYYATNIDVVDKKTRKDAIRRDRVKENQQDPLPDWCVNVEEEHRLKTQEFNETLAKDPTDVESWLRYIKFQEELSKFQRFKTELNCFRTTCQRQLSIAEKALDKNPDSVELLKTKLRLMSELMPADEFSSVVESLLNKDSGNLVLWRTLIMTIQSSVSLCKVPRVLELHSKCLNIFRQKYRSNPVFHDKQILGILYECLMFLRHAGYWEQMWETMRMNLSLNFDIPQEHLKMQCSIDEKKIIDMEEVILTSRLPLNQLWLRVESLRERCHWITVDKDQLELVGDSKRYILPEDVADFVHPLLSMGSNFLMGIYFLLSLKVPLLPSRSNTLKSLRLDTLNWSLDSLEILLPMACPFIGELAGQSKRESLIKDLLENQLTSGPQFLRFHPAQEAYLDFVRAVFRLIGDTLHPRQRTSIYVWWLRFERLLIFLGRFDPLKTDNKGKKVKAVVKDFLKKSENRNNLHFYREYALIERQLGKFDSCLNILETAIQSQGSPRDDDEKSAVFSIFRALFETLLSHETCQESNVDRVLKVVAQLVPASAGEDGPASVQKYLADCVEEFLSQEPPEDSEDDFFMPNLNCDKIVCYAYFLYATKHPIAEVDSVFDSCLQHSEPGSNLQEQLYESKTAIWQLHFEKTREQHDVLAKTAREGLQLFRDNFYLLSINAEIQCELPSWKIDTRSEEIRLWPAVAMCLANRVRIQNLRSLEMFDAANAALNKTLSFYKTLIKLADIQCCPLIWRLYMLLLREENLQEKKGEQIYHESVQNCPWVRSIYIDAAEVAPQVLQVIQDVIREKELRMHVTPEELDILRG